MTNDDIKWVRAGYDYWVGQTPGHPSLTVSIYLFWDGRRPLPSGVETNTAKVKVRRGNVPVASARVPIPTANENGEPIGPDFLWGLVLTVLEYCKEEEE